MEEMIYLGQVKDVQSQYGMTLLDDMSDEEIEQERNAFLNSFQEEIDKYGQETMKMLDQLQDLAYSIRKNGVPQKRISDAVIVYPELKDILITRDYKILIPECNNVEIELDPVPKTLYFLFLRHKDGLLRTDLKGLEDEIIMIMKAILHTDDLTQSKTDAIRNLIGKKDDEVSGKTKIKSFSDNCNAIKNEFLKVFDEDTASYYYITGQKGKMRGIKLPRYHVKVASV